MGVEKLSSRQLECLRLVAALRKTEQIADELGISPSTVNTHIERAMVILGTTSRREAARIVAADAANPRPEQNPTEFPRRDDVVLDDAPTSPAATSQPPRRNRLNGFQRLGLGIAALALLCIAIAGLGAAIEQLSAWRSGLAQAKDGAAPLTRHDGRKTDERPAS